MQAYPNSVFQEWIRDSKSYSAKSYTVVNIHTNASHAKLDCLDTYRRQRFVVLLEEYKLQLE